MTNDGWSSKWPSGPIFPQQLIEKAKRDEKEYTDMYGTEINPVALGFNPKFNKAADEAMRSASGMPDEWQTDANNHPEDYGLDRGNWPEVELTGTAINKIWQNDQAINSRQFKLQGSNLVDNEAYLYFQCDSCGEILDPHTKSFQTLQEKRVNAGWKCAWNLSGMGYKVYCEGCGEKSK